jgi:NAD(P)-dependent dehydrogenase (short-subunit alcohol dehydrogenase family)
MPHLKTTTKRMPNIDPRTYQPPANLLENRVILVTGAGSGIGRAAARSFADHGATVILLGRTVSKLESLYDEIIDSGAPTPAISVMNLAKAQGPDYFQLAEQIETEYGRLDGLLHNAGILGHRTPLEQYEVATWTEVMHINLTAPFVLTQVLLPLLKKSPDASCVFTSSGVGRKGRAYWGAYAVSKFGTEGLAQVLADETASTTLRVNCINPGATRTAMRHAAYPGEDPESLPMPEEILASYLYLFGPDSHGISGQSLDAQ